MKTFEQRVYEALSEVTPKPISQLVEETGMAYGTVRDYLKKLNARAVPGVNTGSGGVARWLYLRPGERVDHDTLVKTWRGARRRIAARVEVLTISEGADPVWLADEFIELGQRLLEIGTEIDRVKMDPDWYQRLGGHFWLSDEKGRMQ